MGYKDYLEDLHDAYYCDKDECFECEEKENVLENATRELSLLLKKIYDPKEFDEETFEDNLENLCNALYINLPNRPIKITGKKND